ncbi:MAG: hypothetical protein VCD31_00600 [Alphaproteobacteria bacterium]
MLRLIETRKKPAVGLTLDMDTVMPQRERQNVSGIGDLLFGADTDPAAGPNFFVFEVCEYFRAISCGRQGLRTSEWLLGRCIQLWLDQIQTFVEIS